MSSAAQCAYLASHLPDSSVRVTCRQFVCHWERGTQLYTTQRVRVAPLRAQNDDNEATNRRPKSSERAREREKQQKYKACLREREREQKQALGKLHETTPLGARKRVICVRTHHTQHTALSLITYVKQAHIHETTRSKFAALSLSRSSAHLIASRESCATCVAAFRSACRSR